MYSMSYVTTIKKFGNSRMIIFPNKVADFLELYIDSEVELKMENAKIIIIKKER